MVEPINTLAAQTYMILFIVLYQFRPKGIFALKAARRG